MRNAAIIDLKVRGEAYRAEIEKTLESLETYEDAQRYAEEVRQRVMAAKALKKAGE